MKPGHPHRTPRVVRPRNAPHVAGAFHRTPFFDRGLAQRDPQAAVGASIWQTPGGVQAELEQINGEFQVFGSELGLAVQREGYPGAVKPTAQRLVDLYTAVWLPLQAQWRSFFDDHSGWWGNLWWNHAPQAEELLAQLVEVRAKAGQLGMNVLSPAPARPSPSILFDPEHNLVDRTVDGARTAITDLWSVIKVGLYGCLGIAGVAALIQVSRARRSNR